MLEQINSSQTKQLNRKKTVREPGNRVTELQILNYFQTYLKMIIFAKFKEYKEINREQKGEHSRYSKKIEVLGIIKVVIENKITAREYMQYKKFRTLGIILKICKKKQVEKSVG